MLARALFQEVDPDFLRILAAKSGLYVDVLDTLECRMSERSGSIERDEAISHIERVLEAHGDVRNEISEESGGTSSPRIPREMARAIIEILIRTRWIHEEQRSDWTRMLSLDPNGILLIQTLRKIANPQSTFSDKIVNVCTTLTAQDTIDKDAWPQIAACSDNLRTGLDELRGMQKAIERHIRLQLRTSTMRESMAVLFDQFAPLIGRGCYSELVHARLPRRLIEARDAIRDMQLNLGLLEKMQSELMRREPSLEAGTAMARVRLRLQELEELLEQVVPLAGVIDRRTADFSRRSLARFRYLQEVTGDNRRRAQVFMECINRLFAGRRMSDLDEAPLGCPNLLLMDPRQIAGQESLYTPRLRRNCGELEPVDEEISDDEREQVLAGLRAELRGTLTVDRANRYVSMLPENLGRRISSADLPVQDDSALADLLACLLHAQSKTAIYQIEVPHAESGDDLREWDRKLDFRVERFTIVRE